MTGGRLAMLRAIARTIRPTLLGAAPPVAERVLRELGEAVPEEVWARVAVLDEAERAELVADLAGLFETNAR